MTELNEDLLAGIRTARERKLSNAERLAIFAFARRGVPVKILARTFAVTPNAIRYITNYEHTAAHEHAKQMFEQYGEARVMNEIVTEAQTESINEGMRRMFEGKNLKNDSGYRRGTLAVALVLDEPEQLISYLKQQTMTRMDAVAPLDAHLAKKWAAVAEGLADIETALGDVKRPRPAAADAAKTSDEASAA